MAKMIFYKKSVFDILVAAILVLFLSVSIVSAGPGEDGVIRDNFYRAQKHYKNKQYDKAIKYYSEAFKLDKEKNDSVYAYDIHLHMGLVFFEVREYKRSILEYEKALKIRSNSYKAYHGLGIAFKELGEFQKAIEFLSKSIKFKPNYPTAYYNRGGSYYKIKKYEEAITDYNKAIDLKPDYSSAYHMRAMAFSRIGQYQQSINDYNKVNELDPRQAFAYGNRGEVYFEMGEYKKAISEYNKALAISYYPAALSGRGGAYAKNGQYNKALEDLENTLKMLPNYDEALSHMAWIFATSKAPGWRNGEAALKRALQAIKHGENDYFLFKTLGAAYAENGDFLRARDEIDKAIKLYRKEPFVNKRILSSMIDQEQTYKKNSPWRE